MSISNSVTSLSWSSTSSSTDSITRRKQSDTLAVGYDSGLLLLADFRGKQGICVPICAIEDTAKRRETGITCLEWDPTRIHILATGSKGGRIVLWDDRKLNAPLTSVGFKKGSIASLSWNSAYSGTLAYSMTDVPAARDPGNTGFGIIRCSTASERDLKPEKVSTDMETDKVLWARDGRTLITCQSVIKPKPSSSSSALSFVSSRSDGLLSSCKHGNELPANHPIVIYSYPSCSEVARYHGHSKKIMHAALSDDSQLLVTGGLDRILKVWEMPKRANKAYARPRRFGGDLTEMPPRI